MYCIEFFHKYNTGPTSPSYLILFGDPKKLDKEYLNELVAMADPVDMDENYRGYSYKILDKIPKELLLSRISELEHSVRNKLTEIKEYKKYLNSIYNEPF